MPTVKVPTVKEVIFSIYTERQGTTGLLPPDPFLLFSIIIDYMQQNNWKYDGISTVVKLEDQPHRNPGYKVNCFDLANLMIELSKCIGVAEIFCQQLKLDNFASRRDAGSIPIGFDTTDILKENEYGNYEFDVHGIAIINGWCFDLTLQTYYSHVNHGVDIYHALACAMLDDIFSTFEQLFPYLLDVNEAKRGWTLLDQACANKKYSWAKFLIANGADASQNVGMLCRDLADPNTNEDQKVKIEECLMLQAAMDAIDSITEIETQNQKVLAAIKIQAVTRGYIARKRLRA